MKLITFSLWGQNPKYLIGAIRNAELAERIYPDWICRFYVSTQSVPGPIINKLGRFSNVQIYPKHEWGDWKGMFWRFEPASEENVEVMISRDTDSRLNLRERAAVDAWLDSKKNFHIMRDHPYHRFPVLGGMWGAKKGACPQMKTLIQDFEATDEYGTDYKFFAEKVLPTLDQDQILTHDEFFGGSPFPLPREGSEFVGEVFDENDNNVPEHAAALKAAINENR